VKGEELKLLILPTNHECFGPELGFGLGENGLLPDNRPILRLVALITFIVVGILALGIACVV
jgi:hypothetical protein